MDNGDALYARIAELEKENEMLETQTGDLWELASYYLIDGNQVIDHLIEMRGESYVKEVFAEDYEAYKAEKESDSDEESDEGPKKDKVNASPSAQQFCRDNGLDITKFTGSGVEGRIILKDVKGK